MRILYGFVPFDSKILSWFNKILLMVTFTILVETRQVTELRNRNRNHQIP